MNSKKTVRTVKEVLFPPFVVLCFYAFISAAVVFASFVGHGDPEYTSARTVAAKAFQLESNKEYPFRYGKRIEGSSGYAETAGGLFSSHASVSLQPASALSVDYQYGGNSYILELPVSRIRFIQKESGVSSIRLKISNDNYHHLDRYPKHLRWWGVPYFGQDTKPLQKNRWFKSLKADGQLGPLVQEYFQSATITLNPKDYSRILGD